ncbi:MAG: MarC family protein [Azovibrio sp.]|uniref:MarC family protein n=1 Tax=Azovibrio sp. TaxID=1872673 RepID=UPI003C76C705
MLASMILILKNVITLFALVEPVAMIPIFVAATEGLDAAGKIRFARTIGISVTIALLVAAFLGMPLLSLLGVSLGAMQVGGGIIVLLLSIAMVLGKETSFKGTVPSVAIHDVREATIIPLAIPLLAGPAAFSYVMAHSEWKTYSEAVQVVLPILIVGFLCWLTFRIACQAERQIRKKTLDLVERVSGFILAAIAVEMIAAGLRGLFPVLAAAG